MLSLFFANVLGWLVANWKIALPAAIVVTLLLGGGLWWACRPAPAPKLDQEQILKNQEALRSGEAERVKQAVIESKMKEAEIDANRADADVQRLKAVQEAKQEANRMTPQELTDFLENRK